MVFAALVGTEARVINDFDAGEGSPNNPPDNCGALPVGNGFDGCDEEDNEG